MRSQPKARPTQTGRLGWYAIDGVRYLGPFRTKDAAERAAKVKFTMTNLPGHRNGTVELLYDGVKFPTYGIVGPLKPRYTV